MEYQITGKVAEVYPVNRVNERFRKREFVIEHKDSGSGQAYVDFIKSSARSLMNHGSGRM